MVMDDMTWCGWWSRSQPHCATVLPIPVPTTDAIHSTTMALLIDQEAPISLCHHPQVHCNDSSGHIPNFDCYLLSNKHLQNPLLREVVRSLNLLLSSPSSMLLGQKRGSRLKRMSIHSMARLHQALSTMTVLMTTNSSLWNSYSASAIEGSDMMSLCLCSAVYCIWPHS